MVADADAPGYGLAYLAGPDHNDDLGHKSILSWLEAGAMRVAAMRSMPRRPATIRAFLDHRGIGVSGVGARGVATG
jgi:hypothetical protein